MTQGLPDDLFRPGAEEAEAREEQKVPRVSKPTSVKTIPLEPEGVSPRLVVGILMVALLAAFVLGRTVIFQPSGPLVTVSPAPSVSASAVSPPSDDFVAYSGAVVTVPALSASATCDAEGTTEYAFNLIDNDPVSIWRCPGDGVEEQLVFTFSGNQPLVGVRVVNGNSVWTDRYLMERRILSLKWEFDDGSYFVQGLAANNRNLQEVRFPPITVTAVTLTLLEVTEPGDDSANSDAVSIANVEFLSPA